MDAVSIRIDAETGAEKRIMMMGLIENITVKPAEAPARVIVNARTGTVVINGAVRITSAAVTHGKLTVRVDEQPRVDQPLPFSKGKTAVEADRKSVASGQSVSTRVDPGGRRIITKKKKTTELSREP